MIYTFSARFLVVKEHLSLFSPCFGNIPSWEMLDRGFWDQMGVKDCFLTKVDKSVKMCIKVFLFRPFSDGKSSLPCLIKGIWTGLKSAVFSSSFRISQLSGKALKTGRIALGTAQKWQKVTKSSYFSAPFRDFSDQNCQETVFNRL